MAKRRTGLTLPSRLASFFYNSVSVGLLLTGCLLASSVTAWEPVRYNRDVRPILSENCFECHGPDAAKRKADLRLDAGALGQAVVVPGQPEASELFQRITHADPEERMPPVDSSRALTSSDIETLRAWISQGAKWESHWAFNPPRQPT
ncbi:MAG: c-type cytochrome domain-containing protein, partial [Nitrospinaceae bacterium]|nr:c-type cytochrome domain-containing protein [Nitrospinaceae bacterium]